MITYAEVTRFDDTEFGQVRFIGTADSLPNPHSTTLIFVDLTDVTPVPQLDWYYDKAADLFSIAKPGGAVVPKVTITYSELWFKRFSDSEAADVWLLLMGKTVSGVTISDTALGRLGRFRDATLAGEPIPLHSNEVETVINGLESAGLLAAGRAAEILA